jgi:flagellar motility protein MotE (MotC chaperone)
MAKKNKDGDEKKDKDKEGSKVLTVLISLLIVIIWLAVFGILIKLDVGGFGSGVLRPILKDVPLINQVLPDVSEDVIAEENNYEYKSLSEAVARIKELEATIDDMSKNSTANSESTADLQAEIDRLKVFEDNQKAFEERVAEFDKNVVFSEAAPDIEEYKKYYEEIDPANAENIYRQVIEQLQYSDAIKEKADIYRSMDPEAAAQILETMTADVESVAQILLSMKPKESAAILAEMDSVVAAKITKKMLDMDAEKLAEE